MTQNLTCTNCGANNFTNARYCSRCGHDLPKTEVIPEPEPVRSSAKIKLNMTAGKWLGLLAGIAIVYVLQYYLLQVPAKNKMMVEIAGEINKACPLMIDGETRLDNALALPGNTFQYNHTLVNAERAAFDTMTVKALAEPAIIEYVKTEPLMEYPREQNTTINYCYRDKNGAYLFTVSVTPDQYE